MPAVVSERLHGDVGPLGFAVVPIKKPAVKLIVAVGENVRFDNNGLSDDALDWKTSAIDRRLHAFDDHPVAPGNVLENFGRRFGQTPTVGGSSHARKTCKLGAVG